MFVKYSRTVSGHVVQLGSWHSAKITKNLGQNAHEDKGVYFRGNTLDVWQSLAVVVLVSVTD